jgi:kumamolisin
MLSPSNKGLVMMVAGNATRETRNPLAKLKPAAQQHRIVLQGSERSPLQSPALKPTSSSAALTVSVILKRKQPLEINNGRGAEAGPVRISRAQYRSRHSADPRAVQLVKSFAREYGLTVKPDPLAMLRRTLQLSGKAADMERAFGVTLQQKKIDGQQYRTREGEITLPQALDGAVEAVLGLDNRPQAKPHFRIRKPNAKATSYTPVQVAELYQFPAKASGAGQTIGIIELGGGYRQADLAAYFKTLGMKAPKIVAVSVDGGKNSPSTASGADGEVMLDIEVSASVAPGAKVAIYFTPNTDQGFIDAITTAVHDTKNKPSVISISWGGPESSWTMQSMQALDAACQSAAALGVTITVAAGDNGSSDGGNGNNVDFPASSPHVLACGGTTLVGSGATISSETVWNETASNEGATGGGVSNVFAKPTWQANANVPAPSQNAGGRGVPDVAGDADPTTGYTIRVDGEPLVIGGTSAVAPLWAGLIAVANAQLGRNVGLIQPVIYAGNAAAAFNDITQGNNGAFSAGPGWDACTGLGSPRATALIPLLATAASGGPSRAKKAAAKKATKKQAAKKHAVKKHSKP